MLKNFKITLFFLLFLIIVCFIINLNVGYISIDFSSIFQDTTQSTIVWLRINRVIAILLAGIAIPTSGFLLQEYFQNPLAGPSVLGITSVASLSVAIFIFLSQDWAIPEFLQNSFLGVFAILGSMIMMFLLLGFSNKFSDKSYLIIFGFLISALSGAMVSILQLYANNQSLKNYILWSFGANNILSTNQIFILVLLIIIGLFFSFKSIKPLIGNSLGNAYAKSFGVNLNQLKYLIIIASSLLSASVTAFLGPILFIGIVVPHFCRLLYNPSRLWHQWILNMVLGILIIQIFSIISELIKIPINVITSLFGIPVILIMLMKSKSYTTQ